ncbi:MAG: NADH-quinone oxidoreductase subunit NuoN [Steroidobacteraceae bacterium]
MMSANLNFVAAYPEIFVLTAACVILLADLFISDKNRIVTYLLSMLSLVGAAWVTSSYGVTERTVTFNGSYVADPMGTMLKLFAYGATALSFLYSREYLQRRGLFKGEYFVLALFALLGVMVMISAASLLTVYLGVELLSLSLYGLVAFDRDNGVAAESAMKYFVLGAIASGMLLYGMSMIYGVTGSLELNTIAGKVTSIGAGNVGLAFGLAFLVVGVAFKFGAVPFHMWVPDVYHGAPTAVTLFVGSAPKIASFALAMRLLVDGLGGMVEQWRPMLIVLAVLSMAVGNIVAIAQTNLKRMLAYSTISHVGFILLGVLAGTIQGYQAAMFYTLTYVLTAVGSFGVILLLSRQGFESDELDDFKGLSKKSPWFAAVMAMLIFSTAGVPPFVGFTAKLAVIQAVISIGDTWLAGVAVFFSVIGAYYYIRVVKLMYFDAPVDHGAIQASGALRTVLSANGLAVLVLGLLPGVLLDICARVIL